MSAIREVKGDRSPPNLATALQMPRNSLQASMPGVSSDAVMSFIKQTKSLLTWTLEDMAATLKISLEESKQVIAVFELQGYINHPREPG
jgi:hypothetical protein